MKASQRRPFTTKPRIDRAAHTIRSTMSIVHMRSILARERFRVTPSGRIDGMAFPAPHEWQQSRRRRWWTIAISAFVAFWVVYALAVLTPAGQAWENAALDGSRQVSRTQLADADSVLAGIQVWTIAIGLALIALIGLLRREWVLTLVAVGVVVCGVGTTEVLKHWVLPRPDLVSAAIADQHNSFPSGHTTIAMTFMVSVFLVVPYRWRGWAMLAVMGWATGIGSYTVTAHWHRLSDTLGADLVAIVLGSLAALVLSYTGWVRPYGGTRRFIGRSIYVIGALAIGLVALVLGVFLGVAAAVQGTGSEVSQFNAYLAAMSLASAGSILGALLYWWSWRGAEVAPRAARSAAPADGSDRIVL